MNFYSLKLNAILLPLVYFDAIFVAGWGLLGIERMRDLHLRKRTLRVY